MVMLRSDTKCRRTACRITAASTRAAVVIHRQLQGHLTEGEVSGEVVAGARRVVCVCVCVRVCVCACVCDSRGV